MVPSANDPPAYDELNAQAPTYNDSKPPLKSDSEPQAPVAPTYIMFPGPSTYQTQPFSGTAPMVYRYVNVATGEEVASLLPPSHPDMVCLQSGHATRTQYSLLGLLAAVFWFPLGIGLCLLDRQVKCTRCGATIEEGVCG